MSIPLIIFFAVIAGGLVAVQGAINSQLGVLLSHPLQAAFISFIVGSIGLWLVVMFMHTGMPTLSILKGIPPKLYIGGLFGAAFITATIIFIPKIGVANMLIATLLGQILVSLLIDHFGWLGVPQKPVEASRLIGASLVIVGLFFINNK